MKARVWRDSVRNGDGSVHHYVWRWFAGGATGSSTSWRLALDGALRWQEKRRSWL